MAMSHFLASVSLLVFANLVARETVFASFLDDNKIARCDPRTTLPGYGILVTHGMPSPHNGNVVLKSMMNKSLSYADPSCAWSYTVYDHNVVTYKEWNTSLWLETQLAFFKIRFTGSVCNRTV